MVKKMVIDKKKKNKYDREWYQKNKEHKLKYKKEYLKKTNYKHEKTKEQLIIRNIKRRTRYHFPILGKKCICGNDAEVRHHTTNPIEYDKFDFLCKRCHKNIHSNIITGKKGVKNGRNEKSKRQD